MKLNLFGRSGRRPKAGDRVHPRLEELEVRDQPSTLLGTIGHSAVLLRGQVTEAGTILQQVTPGHTRSFSNAPASPHAEYYETRPYIRVLRDLAEAGIGIEVYQPQLILSLSVPTEISPTD